MNRQRRPEKNIENVDAKNGDPEACDSDSDELTYDVDIKGNESGKC